MKKFVLFLAVALLIISTSMTSSSVTEEQVACPDIFTLEESLIREMTKRYKDSQLTFINDRLKLVDGLGDTRAIWLSLEVLEDFICQIKTYVPGGVNNKGVRIYYTAYPEEKDWRDYRDLSTPSGVPIVPKTYAERHTLVLIPTIRQAGVDQDYTPQQGDPMAIMIGTAGDEPGRNHGSLFPPKKETGLRY